MATLETPTEGMARDFAAGQQLASGFMANYWRAREGQIEQERYRAGQALRDVQLSLYQSNLEAVRNAATLRAQQQSAVPGLFGVLSKAQVNQWNPDSKLEFLQYLKDNPALATTPEAQQGFKLFEESEKVDRIREDLEKKLQNARVVAEIREGQPAGGGSVTTVDVADESGKPRKMYWSGSSWQPLSRGDIDPSAVAKPIVDENGKPVPGKYLLDGRVISASDSGLSVFGSGQPAASQAKPAGASQSATPTVLKFDKSGKRIN